MSEMIERVAVAIRKVNAETIGLTYTELTREMARAAIAAMREPTDAMAFAVDGDWGPQLEDNWRKMIDEALK